MSCLQFQTGDPPHQPARHCPQIRTHTVGSRPVVPRPGCRRVLVKCAGAPDGPAAAAHAPPTRQPTRHRRAGPPLMTSTTMDGAYQAWGGQAPRTGEGGLRKLQEVSRSVRRLPAQLHMGVTPRRTPIRSLGTPLLSSHGAMLIAAPPRSPQHSAARTLLTSLLRCRSQLEESQALGANVMHNVRAPRSPNHPRAPPGSPLAARRSPRRAAVNSTSAPLLSRRSLASSASS